MVMPKIVRGMDWKASRADDKGGIISLIYDEDSVGAGP